MTQQHKHKGGVVAATYPPGYFTAKLWPHTNWPHVGWVPQIMTERELLEIKTARNCAAAAQQAIDAGKLHSITLEGGERYTAAQQLLHRLLVQRATKAGAAMPAGKAKP